MRLEEGSFWGLHWLVSSLNHLAGPTGGFHGPLLPSTTAASFPSQKRPGGTRWECLPKRQVGGNLMRCTRGALTHLVWRLLTGHPSEGPFMCSLGRTGRPGVIISTSSSLPPMTISVLTAYGRKFIGRGVEGDSLPLRLTWRLHRLLVWGCWPTPGGWEWLAQGWHHLRSLQWWGLRC